MDAAVIHYRSYRPLGAFELVSQKTVKAYVDLKDNHNQVAWLYQKKGGVVRSALKGMALQEFLDT